MFIVQPRSSLQSQLAVSSRPEVGAHERSHTEAFFRKVKFWNSMKGGQESGGSGIGDDFNSGAAAAEPAVGASPLIPRGRSESITS